MQDQIEPTGLNRNNGTTTPGRARAAGSGGGRFITIVRLPLTRRSGAPKQWVSAPWGRLHQQSESLRARFVRGRGQGWRVRLGGLCLLHCRGRRVGCK